MEQGWIKLVETGVAQSIATAPQSDIAAAMLAHCLASAQEGDSDALFDLGVVYSTGSHGVEVDLVEAHKWFNLAAVRGHEDAAGCRADISEDMTAREIAEAQRRAREWLRASPARKVA